MRLLYTDPQARDYNVLRRYHRLRPGKTYKQVGRVQLVPKTTPAPETVAATPKLGITEIRRRKAARDSG